MENENMERLSGNVEGHREISVSPELEF